MIYYSVPPVLTANYLNTLMIGMTTLQVTTEPYAYIALSMNGILLDARIADATGAATLNFNALTLPGTADIVITKQNRQPHMGTIQVIPASGPYVVYTGNTISDPVPGGNNNGQMDFGEINQLNVSLKNVGVQSATGVVATLSSVSTYVTITDNTENYGNINPDQTITMNGAFTCNVAAYVPDQQVIPFVVQAVSGTNSWSSNFNITANAPVLQIGVLTVQDNGPGCDNDGILDPGETADLHIITGNNGHADVTNVLGSLTITGGSSPFLTLNNPVSYIGNLPFGSTAVAVFNVTADPATPVGTPVDFSYMVTGGATSQYSAQAAKQVVIGLIPVFNMSNTTVTTCTGYFYDSGGPSGNYQNSENFTMTFNPSTPGSMIRVTFESFNTESGYDYLRIYNGANTSAALLGTYHGTTNPGTITASNASGALTFNFTSDGSVTPAGWEASVSCYSTTVPPVADFMAAPLNPQVDQTVTLSDLSEHFPSSWSWSISPATFTFVGGTSATSQNPQVQFSVLGQYTVTLTATNAYGSDTEIKTNYINVHNCTISAFPWSEGFENGGVIPTCWSQEQVNNSGLNWTFITGNGSGYPATAHAGTYNACLKDNSSADHKTRLITPALDLSSLPFPRLKFWHTQAYWSPDQDFLTVYYKTSPSGTWTLLASYTSNITTWTQETIELPGASATYFIAFEGNAKYGRGVCVDDVEVSSACATIYPVSISIAASANPVEAGVPVTFTATGVNEGEAPIYQWKRNNENIGGNTATCVFVPADGDAVCCVLTSNLTCATGNPATSNVITMTVQSVPATLNVANVTVTGTQCFDAIQTIMVAGSNGDFMVQPGGSATMIAGQNIFYFPGTTILAGGYMYGYIAPSGPWCSNPAKEAIIAGQVSPGVSEGQSFFSVYPNPTSGDFTLKLGGISSSEPVTVELYSMKGEKISAAVLNNETTHEFSISEKPAGLYLIRVISGNLNGVARIVKQ
jgi:PKD repeat protein